MELLNILMNYQQKPGPEYKPHISLGFGESVGDFFHQNIVGQEKQLEASSAFSIITEKSHDQGKGSFYF